MMETDFKTLMYNGIYVDTAKLEQGIYWCEKPHLYDKEDTIDSLIKKAKRVEKFGLGIINQSYYDNLNKCKLVDVTITIPYK